MYNWGAVDWDHSSTYTRQLTSFSFFILSFPCEISFSHYRDKDSDVSQVRFSYLTHKCEKMYDIFNITIKCFIKKFRQRGCSEWQTNHKIIFKVRKESDTARNCKTRKSQTPSCNILMFLLDIGPSVIRDFSCLALSLEFRVYCTKCNNSVLAFLSHSVIYFPSSYKQYLLKKKNIDLIVNLAQMDAELMKKTVVAL